MNPEDAKFMYFHQRSEKKAHSKVVFVYFMMERKIKLWQDFLPTSFKPKAVDTYTF